MAETSALKQTLADIYKERRYEAERRGDRRRDAFYGEHPELLEAVQAINEAGARLLEAAVTQQDTVALEEDLQVEREAKDDLLRELGQDPASFDEPDWSCAICHDQGTVDGHPCVCYTRTLYPLLFEQANMEDLSGRTFANFDLSRFSDKPVHDERRDIDMAPPRIAIEARQRHLENAVLHFAEPNDDERQTGNYLFHGPPGTGKTWMASAYANALLEAGHSVLYLSAPALFQQIAEYRTLTRSFRPDRARLDRSQTTMDFIDRAELLVIDDLGTETGDLSTRQSELLTVINSRVSHGRATVIVSNLDLESLSQLYDERVLSRIIGHFTLWGFYGQDLRISGAKQRSKSR